MGVQLVTSADGKSYDPPLPQVGGRLRDGALVILPTETVYGVAAAVTASGALERLRRIKGRQQQQAFTVHISSPADAKLYVADPGPIGRRLARRAWPGPLTLICNVAQPEREAVARRFPQADLGELYHERKIGLRCPDHPVARELLAAAAVPVVASSANRAGAAPPTDLSAALRSLSADEVDYAVDAGRTRYNSASTIVEITGQGWTLLREGVLDRRTVRRLATSEIVMVCTGNSCRSPIAEYLFRQRLAERLGVSVGRLRELGYVVSSAGTGAMFGGSISEHSREELARRGIDASGHRSQPVTVELIQRAERIYTMAPEHRETILAMVPDASGRVLPLDPAGAIADPIGGGAEDYRRCAAQIEKAVDLRLEEYLNEDRDW